MTEPTNQELDAIQNEAKVNFTDKVIVLEHGCTLLSRMVTNAVNANGQMILYKPVELVQMSGGDMYMTPWIPMSCDDYIIVMEHRAIAVVEPITDLIKEYHKQIGLTKSECRPEGEPLH